MLPMLVPKVVGIDAGENQAGDSDTVVCACVVSNLPCSKKPSAVSSRDSINSAPSRSATCTTCNSGPVCISHTNGERCVECRGGLEGNRR